MENELREIKKKFECGKITEEDFVVGTLTIIITHTQDGESCVELINKIIGEDGQ